MNGAFLASDSEDLAQMPPHQALLAAACRQRMAMEQAIERNNR